jgi:uncharacterized membrane-anchored protein
MSVAEMKLAAINEISKLNDEASIKEILEHLAKMSAEVKQPFDVDAFFKRASEKYDDVLQKLAQ